MLVNRDITFPPFHSVCSNELRSLFSNLLVVRIKRLLPTALILICALGFVLNDSPISQLLLIVPLHFGWSAFNHLLTETVR